MSKEAEMMKNLDELLKIKIGRTKEETPMWVQKCDICGEEKEIKRFRYKIKVKKEAFSWEDHWWSRLDICDDCQKIIVELIRQRKGEDK